MKRFKGFKIRVFRNPKLIYKYSYLFCYVFTVTLRPLNSSYVEISLNFCLQKIVIAFPELGNRSLKLFKKP